MRSRPIACAGEIAKDTPWNQLVRQVVTARGDSMENGAPIFTPCIRSRRRWPRMLAKPLSLSINCAKCHNHPLKWTNDQYYAFANLFARVRAKGWGGDARNGDGKRTLFVARAATCSAAHRQTPTTRTAG